MERQQIRKEISLLISSMSWTVCRLCKGQLELMEMEGLLHKTREGRREKAFGKILGRRKKVRWVIL